MSILKIYTDDYREHCEFTCDDTKYEWAASRVFNLTTYDGSLDEMFVKKIVEVCKVILDRTTFDYIQDGTNYVSYILVCQLLNQFEWIEWGTSLRGAWFLDQLKSRPILTYWTDKNGYKEVPFTVDNLKTLSKFIESKE